MKKILTLIIAMATTLAIQATDYKGTMAVVINNQPTSSLWTTIKVDAQTDGKYELQLNDFVMPNGDSYLYVGNIDLKNVPATEADGTITLSSKQSIKITEGSDDSKTWIGPMLSATPIPVELTATITDGTLQANITIPFASMGMNIKVLFNSTALQIPNSDFELFHTEKSGKKSGYEPNHWHSFLSATGSLAGTQNAFSDVHTSISDDVRPGSTGSKSILVKATSVFGILANGTITTGRMNAGAMSATDTKNHAEIDLTNTDKDANGDPFYTELVGRPDSIAVWVKFKQATATPEHPYATISAVITDGTYYQDPEDKTYTNVVAKAANKQIASEDKWVRLSIPFDYETYKANNATAKAILVTISTNADPGEGSIGDELYIDDLSLIYPAEAKGISVKGQAIADFDAAKTSYDLKLDSELKASDIVVDGVAADKVFAVIQSQKRVATVTVYNQDLSYTTYTLRYTDPTGITNANSGNGDSHKVVGIYNLNGQQVSAMQAGQVYITKYADGTVVKTIAK